MMDKLHHRGPDAAGVFVGETVALGIKRLAVAGPDEPPPPIFNEDKSLSLVFAGAVYNHPELRASLIDKGHTFATGIGSEVVLHLYEEYGAALVSHLRGMFAFVLHDGQNRRILCARDSFGIKPFYFTRVGGAFLFASEIKAFCAYPGFSPAVNEAALAQYVCFQYSVLPETFFKGVHKLPPGHTMTLQSGEEPRLDCFFTPIFTPADMDIHTAVDTIDDAVRDAVTRHTAGEAEVGSLLSSGVDSSLLAARFNGGKTFTVGFDYDNYNEIEYAKALSSALGKEHFAKTISTDEYWAHLPRVQYFMDEPLADPAAVALYFAAREAGRHVKVALSGEGADEFFGGYNIYREPSSLRFITWLPLRLRRFLGKLAAKIPFAVKGKNLLIRASKTVEERFIGNANIFTVKERAALLKNNAGIPAPADITRPYYAQVKHEDDITKMQYIDINLWMVGDILLKADKMSMAHSVELRAPFLDREVFRAASRIPTRFRVYKGITKYAFRLAAKRYLSPEITNRRKLGFPVPIRIWLREEKYHDIVLQYFTGEAAQRYFHENVLLELLRAHKSGKRDNSRKIWTVFMFLLWHEQYFPHDA
jgi:asparagine synthase (glutamine-hydrolysing)